MKVLRIYGRKNYFLRTERNCTEIQRLSSIFASGSESCGNIHFNVWYLWEASNFPLSLIPNFICLSHGCLWRFLCVVCVYNVYNIHIWWMYYIYLDILYIIFCVLWNMQCKLVCIFLIPLNAVLLWILLFLLCVYHCLKHFFMFLYAYLFNLLLLITALIFHRIHFPLYLSASLVMPPATLTNNAPGDISNVFPYGIVYEFHWQYIPRSCIVGS